MRDSSIFFCVILDTGAMNTCLLSDALVCTLSSRFSMMSLFGCLESCFHYFGIFGFTAFAMGVESVKGVVDLSWKGSGVVL